MTVRLMSDGKLARLEVLRDLDRKRLTTQAAAQLLGLERRQVVPAIEGLSDRRRDWFDLEAPRAPQQPAQARSAAVAPGKFAAHVVRLNPLPASSRQRLLVEFSGQWPAGQEPMSTEEFVPLVA